MRLKSIQLVNQAWYVTTLLAIVKPFMSQKLRNRVSHHYIAIMWYISFPFSSFSMEKIMASYLSTSVQKYYLTVLVAQLL